MPSVDDQSYIDASAPVLREFGLVITTTFYKNLWIAHPELTNLFNASIQTNNAQQQLPAGADDKNTVDLWLIIESIVHQHMPVVIRTEYYPIVGEHLIGAIKEVLAERAIPESLTAWVEAYGLFAVALIATKYALHDNSADSQKRHLS